jgi:hypothetical protein
MVLKWNPLDPSPFESGVKTYNNHLIKWIMFTIAMSSRWCFGFYRDWCLVPFLRKSRRRPSAGASPSAVIIKSDSPMSWLSRMRRRRTAVIVPSELLADRADFESDKVYALYTTFMVGGRMPRSRMSLRSIDEWTEYPHSDSMDSIISCRRVRRRII